MNHYDDYGMFTADGAAAVARMVAGARDLTATEPEETVQEFLAVTADQIAADNLVRPDITGDPEPVTGMSEVFDTAVREYVAEALDEAWQAAYGSGCPVYW